MAALAELPWPDAAGRAAGPATVPTLRIDARIRTVRPLSFWVAVGVFLTFSQGWVMFFTGPTGDAAASKIVPALFLPAYAAAVVLLLANLRASVVAAFSTPLLWLLLGIVVASTLWSVEPSVTQRRVVALTFTTLAGVALGSRFDWPDLSEILAFGFGFLVIGSFALALLLPSWGRMTELFPGAWRGLWNEKNALGDHMAQGFTVFAAAALLNPRRRLRWAFFAVLTVILIGLSQSKTSLVTLALALAMLAFIALVRRGGVIAVAATFVAVVGAATLALLVVFASDQLFKLLGKDATLTGRTTIWAAVLRRVDERPLFGWGYVATWQDEDRWAPLARIVKEAKFRPQHAHNSWIETRLDEGLVGLFAWCAFYGDVALRSLVACYRNPGAWLAAPFVLVWTFQSLTETIAFIYNDFVWVIFVAIAVRLAMGRLGLGRVEEVAAAP